MDTQLAAIIVHDLKNALGVLEGELHDMTAAPDRKRAIRAHETCLLLQDKLVGFLTLYKASSQGLEARIEAVSPEDFLHELVSNRVTGRTDLNVFINVAGMPVVGFFDENLLALAIEAALQNAMRFARTSIEIGCRKDGEDLLFYIHDDGPGLGTKEQKSSTGLGTELCNAIAGAHRKDGRCGEALLSNHPDGGALFTLRLP